MEAKVSRDLLKRAKEKEENKEVQSEKGKSG